MKHYFSSDDIRWIKSVTRDKGKAWAYLDVSVGDTFPLNFSKNPKWYPTNYKKAKPRELIALFQTIEATNDYTGGWYVTHLVSPIDENIEIGNNITHPYTRLVAVVAVNSTPKDSLIDSNIWSFYKCNRGQVCDIKTIERRNGVDFSIERKQQFIWNLFKNIDIELFGEIPDINNNLLDLDDYIAEEGQEKTVYKLHRFKERDPKIISQAKKKAELENRLHCEICSFNFNKQYPLLGNNFIECHHKQPISNGGIRKTRVEDLAIVCANCHRMLHRKHINGNYLSVEELGKIIKQKWSGC